MNKKILGILTIIILLSTTLNIVVIAEKQIKKEDLNYDEVWISSYRVVSKEIKGKKCFVTIEWCGDATDDDWGYLQYVYRFNTKDNWVVAGRTDCPGCIQKIFTFTVEGTYTIYLGINQIHGNEFRNAGSVSLSFNVENIDVNYNIYLFRMFLWEISIMR